MKKTILYLIVIAAIASSCKKYEEGPCISLKSPEKRLYGAYSISSYSINGEESLSLFKDSLATFANFTKYSDNSEITFSVFGDRKDGKRSTLNCGCNFSDKYSNLNFTACDGISIGTGPFSIGIRDISYEILKLTSNEVKLKTLYNNNEYVVVMKRSH